MAGYTWRSRWWLLAVLTALRGAAPASAQAPPDAPFVITGSATGASARVDATVTRSVSGNRITLPAAQVPALAPGDSVDVAFPDYTRPPARANYHVDVAFITEVAPQHWLFERSSPQDRLFTAAHGRRATPPPAPHGLHFVYGPLGRRGIPIFAIVPEDAKTRGMDDVRDYLNAHPTDFKDMAQSANEAIDRYEWFADFSSAIAQGSIDPVSAQQRVQSVAGALGASPAAVSACYAAGGTNAVIADCINTTLQSVTYPTNIEAPTQAQFFGGAFGAVAPVAIANFLVPLLSIWKVFIHTGHLEYEYLPASLYLPHDAGPDGELLTGLKVPTLRPPAAVSDVLFFTIGDPQAAANPPVIENAAPATGICAAGERVSLPLHLDRTSAYVHDMRAVITPDGKSPYSVPIDARTAGGPVLRRDQLSGAADAAYRVRLSGRYGFDPIAEPAPDGVRIVEPYAGAWALEPVPHRSAVAGGTFDAFATAPFAPCVSHAELQIGSAAPIPLGVTHLSDRRLSLHASLAHVPPGDAVVRLYQTDVAHDTELESDVAVTIGAPAANVDPNVAVTATIGDAFIALHGAAFETVSELRLNGAAYMKDSRSTATDACFTGPVLGARTYVAGESLSAQLVAADGAAGEVFVVNLTPPRPALQPPRVVPAGSTHLSTQTLDVELATTGAPLPSRFDIRLHQAPPVGTPCAAVRDDNAAPVTVPAAAIALRSATRVDITLTPDAMLGDRAFGAIQIQLVDSATKMPGAWLTLPGVFVRSPRVDRIACPADGSAPCALYGTGLTAIASIDDAAGRPIALGRACPPDGQLACLDVPRLPAYVLHLSDGPATLTVAPVTAMPAASPAARSSAPAASAPPVPAPAASPERRRGGR